MTSSRVLLQVRDLSCVKDREHYIFENLNLDVEEGDVIVIQGRSGSGKSTLLKALAHLNVYEGEVLYRGRTPKSFGIPYYRTQVHYVPQRSALLPGTPRDFVNKILSFSARKSSKTQNTHLQDAIELSQTWGVDSELWDRAWPSLSGGEAQRIVLAIALSLNTAEVLLLDEPTSALDSESSSYVEKTILSELKSSESVLKALIWITHSDEQGRRVGSRFISMSNGNTHEEAIPV